MVLVGLVLLLSVASHAQGLSCYKCSDYDFDGELTAVENCHTVEPTGSNHSNPTTKTNCADSAGVEYCKSTFSSDDGVLTAVSRGCDSTGDATDTIPLNQCNTVYHSGVQSRKETTTCIYTCSADNCNTDAAASFQACDTDCNSATGGGKCNYIDGTCHCNAGYSGSVCADAAAAITRRSCVQCSSETDSNCTTSTSSTLCSGDQQYCSTATSKIFDQADTVVKTVTVRGCTDDFVAIDQCTFSGIAADSPINDVGYREFTCYSTCNTDGCNTNTANGVIDPGESVPLQCVQCSETTGSENCNQVTTRTPCTSGSTYCKSTVTYLISERADLSYTGVFHNDVAYELRSVVRECATAAVTAECTETTITVLDEVKKVTCTETCQVDGCNVGWPAAPKCIKCSSDSVIANLLGIQTVNYNDGYDECLENPPLATDCFFPYQRYCFIFDVGIVRDVTNQRRLRSPKGSALGFPRRISRGCTHVDITAGCSPETVRSTTVESCNHTCTTDGCNAGTEGSMPIAGSDGSMSVQTPIDGSAEQIDDVVGGGGFMPMQTLITLMVPAVFGWMAGIFL